MPSDEKQRAKHMLEELAKIQQYYEKNSKLPVNSFIIDNCYTSPTILGAVLKHLADALVEDRERNPDMGYPDRKSGPTTNEKIASMLHTLITNDIDLKDNLKKAWKDDPSALKAFERGNNFADILVAKKIGAEETLSSESTPKSSEVSNTPKRPF